MAHTMESAKGFGTVLFVKQNDADAVVVDHYYILYWNKIVATN